MWRLTSADADHKRSGHLTFHPDAVTSHAKTPIPAEAQNLQGKYSTPLTFAVLKCLV